ncbi:MAG: M48 family metallopeptidase [Pseudomonadota bacterium]
MQLPTPEFKVLLFGPDLPAAGARARARFESSVLVVHQRDHWYTVNASDLDLGTGGFDGRQWIVSWHSPLGTFKAMLQGDEAMETFVSQVPEDTARRLHLVRRRHRQTRRTQRAGLGLLGLALFLPAFALVWYWLNAESFSRWAADQVTVEQEVRLGEHLYEEIRPNLDLLPENALADEVVEHIGVRVSAGSGVPFHFHVARNDQVNAFALPGGHVVIFTGLLEAADSADEVAGVLAHQISHVTLRHSLQGLIRERGLRAVLAVMLGDFAGRPWATMAEEFLAMNYSMDMEREADLNAVGLLRRAALASSGMASFFEKMDDEQGFGIAFLAAHPVDEARLKAIRKAIKAQGTYPYQCLYGDWDEVRDSLKE